MVCLMTMSASRAAWYLLPSSLFSRLRSSPCALEMWRLNLSTISLPLFSFRMIRNPMQFVDKCFFLNGSTNTTTRFRRSTSELLL